MKSCEAVTKKIIQNFSLSGKNELFPSDTNYRELVSLNELGETLHGYAIGLISMQNL